MNDKSFVPVERIERAILLIRGQKIMLDRDLAAPFGVTTGNLNKAVRLAVRGRIYNVETTASLSSPFWQDLAGAGNLIGDNSIRSVTNSASGAAFYRFRARLQR